MQTNGGKNAFANEVRRVLTCGRQVWRLVPPGKRLALGGAALLVGLTSAANTAVPLLLGTLVDNIHAGEEGVPPATLLASAYKILGIIAIIYIGREAVGVLRRYLVQNVCARISQDMSLRLVTHVMKANLGRLNQERIGGFHGKLFRSVDGLIRFLRLLFLDFMPAILTGAFALTAAISLQPVLGLVMLGVLPIAVWLTMRQLITQKDVRLQLMRDCEGIDGAVVEQLGGLEYVRAANTQNLEVERLKKAMDIRRRREVRHHLDMSLFGCAKSLNEGFFHIVVLGAATYFAVYGTISYGDILTFSILFLNVMAPLSEIHRVLDEGHESSLRVSDLLDMLGEPVDPSFDQVTLHTPNLTRGQPAFAMEDLELEYVSLDGKPKRAIHGITRTIQHGETIGIAGRSGCGKSTWLKCLLRLTHPSGGQILLGGVPLSSVSRTDLAKLVGYVGQNPFVFTGTIAENILYGNTQISHEDMVRAAQLANLHDEIMEMPGGYQAMVAERGQNLSGGQRQRLAIARILLKQTPILILDEATSALDNLSERHVQRSLGLTNADRTTFLVAHRLTTLQDADCILVFDQGRIVESGTYEELVRRKGLFAELVLSAENGLTSEGKAPPHAAA